MLKYAICKGELVMFREETGYPSIDKTHLKGVSYLKQNPYIPNMSFYNTLKLMSLFYRQQMAIDCLNLQVSYATLLKNSKIISKAFDEFGIKAGDIITVSMPNFYQAIAIFLAANRMGATVTFLNSEASIEEIQEYLNLFSSPIFINYNKDMEYNKKVKQGTKVRQVITLNKEELNTSTFNKSYEELLKEFSLREKKMGLLEKSCYSDLFMEARKPLGYSDLVSFNNLGRVANYGQRNGKTSFDGKQDALILFTSGSTGNPKSVIITNENIISSGIYMKNTCNIKAKIGEKCLVCVPFSYPYGLITSALMSLLCGREAILAPNLSNEVVSYYLAKNPNYIFGSPALLDLIMKNVPNNQDLSSNHTFISGGDTLFANRACEAKEFFKAHGSNISICNGAGNAEATGTITSAVGVENRPETVGKVLIGESVIILDPLTHQELKYGEEGILYISGKNVFKGYFGIDSLKLNDKFVYKNKVYYNTGNKGILDKEGYFILTGRDKRFFIRSTLDKVYPEKLQGIMATIDIVDACLIVPKPHDEFRYVNKAYVVLKDDSLDKKEARKYILEQCQKHSNIIKSFELPAEIDFVTELPRTRADKIDYQKLEDLAREEYENAKVLQKSLL